MTEQRAGQKVFTMPGPDWGIKVIQSAAAALAYSDKVLSYGPLVYFPMWEPAGIVSEELVNTWNGAYTGVTLGQPGIGDGNTSPFFDGANDFNNIWTAALAAAFSGTEGTVMIWARVFNVGVWTDAALRTSIIFRVDANNNLVIRKWNVNNRLTFTYEAGGVVETVNLNGVATIDWMHLAMTWSGPLLLNEMRAYYNGVQTGLAQVALGGWVGAPINLRTNIGVGNAAVPASLWHGWLAHGAAWDRRLAPAEIAALAIV